MRFCHGRKVWQQVIDKVAEIKAEGLPLNPQAGNKDIKFQIAWVFKVWKPIQVVYFLL